LLAVGVLYVVVVTSFLPIFKCHDTLLVEATDANAAIVAAAYERNCGATTGFARFVNLRPLGKRFDGDAFPIVFIQDGRGSMRLEWTASRRLLIQYSQGLVRPAKRENHWRDIVVSYVSVP
jgi:hypothetical protein